MEKVGSYSVMKVAAARMSMPAGLAGTMIATLITL